MSRNAPFKHLDENHKFCCEWQQQHEAEEKKYPLACDASHINQCPAARICQDLTIVISY